MRKEFIPAGELLDTDAFNEAITINVSLQSENKSNIYSPEGFLNWKIPLVEFDRVVRDFGGSYSPTHYNNSYRLDSEATVGSVNSIMLDFDDGLTIVEARETFSKYEGVIATTKSHQKDKNGIICDRFRVILPTDSPVTLSAIEYKNLMVEVMEVYPDADKACKNISRFYFMSTDSEVERLQGDELFNWKQYYKKYEDKADQRRKIDNIAAMCRPSPTEYESDITKVEWYRKYKNTQEMMRVLKFDTKFVKGNRNVALYSWTMHLKEIGLNSNEVIEIVEFLNKSGDSVPDKELELVFRSCKV